MIHPQMRRILSADSFIRMQLIGSKMSAFIDETINDWQQVGDAVALNRRRPHRTISFNGNQHSLLAGAPATFVNNAFLVTRFATDVFLV